MLVSMHTTFCGYLYFDCSHFTLSSHQMLFQLSDCLSGIRQLGAEITHGSQVSLQLSMFLVQNFLFILDLF